MTIPQTSRYPEAGKPTVKNQAHAARTGLVHLPYSEAALWGQVLIIIQREEYNQRKKNQQRSACTHNTPHVRGCRRILWSKRRLAYGNPAIPDPSHTS